MVRRYSDMKLFFNVRAPASLLLACLLAGSGALAQQPSAPVPSIEELKRQLEEKRQQLQAKRQLEAKQQADAKQQLEAKRKLEAKQQLEPNQPPEATPPLKGKQLKAKQQPAKPTSGEPESGADGALASTGTPAPPVEVAKAAPPAKNIPPVRLEPHSAAAADSCPYPAAARARGDTGTVILLVYVAPDGRATDTRVESSSGSDVLDEAAASCVKEFGHFVPKRNGARAEAGWFRMKYNWTFGDIS